MIAAAAAGEGRSEDALPLTKTAIWLRGPHFKTSQDTGPSVCLLLKVRKQLPCEAPPPQHYNSELALTGPQFSLVSHRAPLQNLTTSLVRMLAPGS